MGETFVSPARTATEADIHSHAALTGDRHPIHTDFETAEKSPFGERIARGMRTLSIGVALWFRLGQYSIMNIFKMMNNVIKISCNLNPARS